MHPVLCSVEILYLPPNITSRIQSLGAGIVAKIKVNYGRRLLLEAISDIGAGSKTEYNIEILTAMRRIEEERNASDSTSKLNCWSEGFNSSADSRPSDLVNDIESDLLDQL